MSIDGKGRKAAVFSAMKVFISWSGEYSKGIAQAIHQFLPDVVQAFKPWRSSEEIRLGNRWLSEISTALQEINFGILCITPDNPLSPWLNFEAGALGKNVKQSAVAGLLFDLRPAEVSGPLTQFQNAEFSKEMMLRLVTEMNKTLIDPVSPERLERSFKHAWPALEDKIKEVKNRSKDETVRLKPERELLMEAVELMRGLSSRLHERELSMPDLEREMRRKLNLKPLALDLVATAIGMDRNEIISGILTGELSYSDIAHLLVDCEYGQVAASLLTKLEAEVEEIRNTTNAEFVGKFERQLSPFRSRTVIVVVSFGNATGPLRRRFDAKSMTRLLGRFSAAFFLFLLQFPPEVLRSQAGKPFWIPFTVINKVALSEFFIVDLFAVATVGGKPLLWPAIDFDRFPNELCNRQPEDDAGNNFDLGDEQNKEGEKDPSEKKDEAKRTTPPEILSSDGGFMRLTGHSIFSNLNVGYYERLAVGFLWFPAERTSFGPLAFEGSCPGYLWLRSRSILIHAGYPEKNPPGGAITKYRP
jgi:hypothetical protein